MAWHPNTLRDAITAGEVPERELDEMGEVLTEGLPQRYVKGKGTVYKCSVCDTHRRPELLVDIRALPIAGDFVCDNCWTDWERRGVAVDGLPNPPVDRVEWKRRWATALGAPQSVHDKLNNVRLVEPYRR